MALGMNDFRSIVIKADAANTSIAPIRLSQNDQDGRRIVFELWNGAESIAATGLTARLLFGVGDGGYATMTAVSGAATATWAVDVPQEALQTAGVVRMAVEVASGSQAVCTRIFDAVVEPALIDEDSPEAQDALSEFRAAVAMLGDIGNVQVNNARLSGTSGGRQAVVATMDYGNICMFALKRGTNVMAIVLIDFWSSNLAIWGTLPPDVVFVRGAASGTSGRITIQNNISSAIAIDAIGCKFGEVADTDTALTENFTRTSMDDLTLSRGIKCVEIASGASATVDFSGNTALVYGMRGATKYAALVDYWGTEPTSFLSASSVPTITKSANSNSMTITNNHAYPMQFTVVSVAQIS